MITATAILLYVLGALTLLHGLIGVAVCGIDYPWPHNRQAMILSAAGLVILFAASILWSLT